MIKKFTGLTAFLFMTTAVMTTASAHSGMEHNSISHNVIHLLMGISIYLIILGAGFYLIRKLPKAIKIRVKK